MWSITRPAADAGLETVLEDVRDMAEKTAEKKVLLVTGAGRGSRSRRASPPVWSSTDL
jgi:hypothetical protein